MSKKSMVWSITGFMSYLLIYWWLTTTIHEWVHLTVLQLLGGNGYILKGISASYVVFTTSPSNSFLVALSGGIGVVILYGVLALLNYKNFNPEGYAAMFPLIVSQLFYAIYEAIYIFIIPTSQFISTGQLVSLLGFLVGLIPALIVMYLQIETLIEVELNE